MIANKKNKIIQGSFPGGMPHKSVIMNDNSQNNYSFHKVMQRKELFNSRIPVVQNNSGENVYQIDPVRLKLNSFGVSLPKEIQAKMESIFNTDFSDVKIHTGDNQAESIGALAFTADNNIYFAHERYNPNSKYGQKLLVHELTHVIQQKSGRVKKRLGNGIFLVNNQTLEAEAERMSCHPVIQARLININARSIIQMSSNKITVDKNNIVIDTSQHNWRMIDSESGVIFAIVKKGSEPDSREFWMTTEEAKIQGNESESFQVVPRGDKFSFLEESVRVIVNSGKAPALFQSHFSGAQAKYFRDKYLSYKNQNKSNEEAAIAAYCDTAFGKAVIRNDYKDIEMNVQLDKTEIPTTVISKAYKSSVLKTKVTFSSK